MTALDYPSVLG